MKLHILSDLHIEFSDIELPKVDADVVILAGDIHVGIKGLDWIKSKFENKKIIYVIGNHEYYYGTISVLNKLIKDTAQKDATNSVSILENDELVIEDVVFLGCTLWTDFCLYGNAESASRVSAMSMNDYNLIRVSKDYGKLRPKDVIRFYNESLIWLKSRIKKHAGKKIVVITHNAPSIKSCLEKYKNDLLTASFASDLEDFITENNNICLWIHGHMHNSSDYTIGNTRTICNPRGYCRNFGKNENYDFKEDLVIEIGNI